MANPPTTQREIRQRLAQNIRDFITPFQSTTTNAGSVFSTAPMNLQRAKLPAIVITDGNSNYTASNPRGSRMVIVNSLFNVDLYNSQWVANDDLNINQSSLDDTVYELEDLFFTRRSLEDVNNDALPFVDDTFLQSATGISVRGYVPVTGAFPSETQYIYKRLVLSIRYRRRVV